jgi:hypothetical protein
MQKFSTVALFQGEGVLSLRNIICASERFDPACFGGRGPPQTEQVSDKATLRRDGGFCFQNFVSAAEFAHRRTSAEAVHNAKVFNGSPVSGPRRAEPPEYYL